ncbi:MAG TPA: rhomboid family intramembrane serine protease [Bryobacteraceae bacterium]|nr:rhomboid family intramembrane serine protease [Bryobacteraceae bacterium]
MSFRTRSYTRGFPYSEYFPAGVKWLLIVNTVVWLLYFFAVRAGSGHFFQHFALMPAAVLKAFAVWQLATYMFLHDPFGFFHITFNMLTLWMFGITLERDWGTRRFLKFYFLCGVGAGVCVVIANALAGEWNSLTIGSSGAIYGLLMAFGMLYPNDTVLFGFLFPMKAKYFVLIIGAIAFLSTFNADSGISNFAHLGGMLFGYLYLKSQRGRRRTFDMIAPIERRYQNWKIERAKKKFQVYLRKQDSDRDRWVN